MSLVLGIEFIIKLDTCVKNGKDLWIERFHMRLYSILGIAFVKLLLYVCMFKGIQ